MGSFFDILVVLVLLFELFLGFLDGFWVRFLRLLGLVFAVVLSAVFTWPLFNLLSSALPISSIKFGFICWLAIFIPVALAAFLLVRWAEHVQDKTKGDGFLSPTSHALGLLVGGIHGVLLVVVMTWCYGMARISFFQRAP